MALLTDAAIQAAINAKTKPLGALGRIESLAADIARFQNTLRPRMERCGLIIFAADHGIAGKGVSKFPQAVTRQMVLNFLAGGAAANVFAATSGVSLRVVDAGVAGDPIIHSRLISRRIAPGTASSLHGPAMTPAQLAAALAAGKALAEEGNDDALAFGEMGIANTSAATLIGHKLTGDPISALTGRGTGLDDAALARKTEILARAAARTPDVLSAEETLIQYGGFEIAMMAGAMLGAARAGRMILVDGFIATAAALAAARLDPAARRAMIFAHTSPEPGHRHLLAALDAAPLLSLGMRLGEGTGALLAWPLVRAAAAMLRDMASFEDAGVSGPV